MTELIKDKLRKQSKLNKIYFQNAKTESNFDNLNIISNECKKIFKRNTCLKDK